MAYLPFRIANSGNSAADTMFWYSFRILPDRLKPIPLYPCGSLGPSISFIFGALAGHFAATPQSDIVRICAHDFGVMATLLVRQKMPFSCSDHNFTYIIVLSELQRKSCQKSPQTLDLSFTIVRSDIDLFYLPYICIPFSAVCRPVLHVMRNRVHCACPGP